MYSYPKYCQAHLVIPYHWLELCFDFTIFAMGNGKIIEIRSTQQIFPCWHCQTPQYLVLRETDSSLDQHIHVSPAFKIQPSFWGSWWFINTCLRHIIWVRWHDTTSKEKLGRRTILWSECDVIEKRKSQWIGHTPRNGNNSTGTYWRLIL